MKKIIKAGLFVFTTLIALSCEEKYPMVDFPSLSLQIHIRNEAGENLLDPNVEGNILETQIYATHNNKLFLVYDFDEFYDSMVPSRTDPISSNPFSSWYGVFYSSTDYFSYDPLTYGPTLFIGQFSSGLIGEEVVFLTIGEKKYKLSFTTKGSGLVRKHVFYLDGKKQVDNHFYITL